MHECVCMSSSSFELRQRLGKYTFVTVLHLYLKLNVIAAGKQDLISTCHSLKQVSIKQRQQKLVSRNPAGSMTLFIRYPRNQGMQMFVMTAA